jgi:phosphoserine phosphatase
VTEAAAQRRFDRGAFFDVDGTLVSTNVVDAYAYYVFHRGTIFGTAQRLIRAWPWRPSTRSPSG